VRLARCTVRNIGTVAHLETDLGPTARHYPLNYIWRNEPRIVLLLRLLRSVRPVASESGLPVLGRIRGLRLRRLRDWVVQGDPVDPGRIMSAVSWTCGMACEFCYQKGTPREMKPRRLATTVEEMDTRIRHYDPVAGTRLFDKTNFDTDEMLNHPEALRFMERLRQKTTEPFYDITTNGKPLTDGVATRLRQLAPVEIGVSLDTVDPGRRDSILHDPEPERAADGIKCLRRHEIPFAVSIVAWPALGIEDLADTIRFADAHSAQFVRVCLPGHSRFFPSPPPDDMEQFWQSVVWKVRELRSGVSTPIVVLPSLYEELLCAEPPNVPYLQGVIRNSPAARAGLQRGDRILAAGGIPLESRPQAAQVLKGAQAQGVWRIEMDIAGDGERRKAILFETGHPRTYRYPYLKEYLPILRHPYGLLLADGPDPWLGRQIHAVARERGARRVAVLTSWLLRRSVRDQLSRVPSEAETCEVDLCLPPNQYFGGSIRMGDLLTNADFIDYIRDHLSSRTQSPDLVLIPTTPFSPWERDLLGRCNREISRRVALPVAFLPARRIWT
jgi:hypothetical protein